MQRIGGLCQYCQLKNELRIRDFQGINYSKKIKSSHLSNSELFKADIAFAKLNLWFRNDFRNAIALYYLFSNFRNAIALFS